jgi:hypothetical protein
MIRPANLLAAYTFVLAGCAGAPCSICGTWKSNEEQTLITLRACGWMNPKREELFGEGFFGRLIIEVEPRRQRAYFVEDGTTNAEWGEYTVAAQGPDYIDIAINDDSASEGPKRMWIDGSCYRVSLGQEGCYETFCRTSTSQSE